MKIILTCILTITTLSISQKALAQAAWYASPSTGTGSLLTNTNTTSVGINTPPSLDGTLTINGNISLNNSSNGNTRFIAGHTTSNRFDLYGNTSTTNGPSMTLWGQTGYRNGGIDLMVLDLPKSNDYSGFTFFKYNQSLSQYTTEMNLDNSGNLSLLTGSLSVYNDFVAYPSYIQRTSIGAAWGAGMYGTGYMAFNLWRNKTTGSWNYINDGAGNGGSVFYGDSNGGFNFSTKTSSGASNGSITDAQVVSGVKMRIDGNGSVSIMNDLVTYPNNIQRTSIGAAWGGGMNGTGFMAFNLWRDKTSGNWNYTNDGGGNGGSVFYGDSNGGFNFSTKTSSGASNGYLTDAQIVSDVKMHIEGTGKVVIGSDLIQEGSWPGTYLLYVEKGILTEKLKVANSSDATNWSDFVFNKDYNLMPLDKVASYIKINKHLPEIPTASEVAKDGIDVAAMDAKLLQKIEELTLYVIEQQKEINELKKQQKH